MKKKVGWFIVLVLAVLSISGLYAKMKVSPKMKDHSIQTISINSKKFQVEYVLTAASIQQGLSDREAIGSDGMMFIFSKERIPTFWMKHMKFPLDFIWINSQKVIAITENVPPPRMNEPEYALPLYSPPAPVTHVLEVPAGFVKENAIFIGQEVILP